MLAHLRELYRFRDLLWSLAVRDLKVRYRQTLLGVLWAVVQPLAFMLIFTVIFAKFGKVEADGAPYPLFSYTALVAWTLFATGLTLSVNSIAANIKLVQKVYFPREVLPLGVVIGCAVDFCIAALLVVGLMVRYGVPPSFYLAWLPWLIGVELVLLVGVSLVASALNVFFRDIKYIVPLAVQLWMFATPVIYPSSMIPERWRGWFMLNPMAVIIENVRQVVVYRQPPDVSALLATTAGVAVFGVLAYVFFKRVEPKFADLI